MTALPPGVVDRWPWCLDIVPLYGKVNSPLMLDEVENKVKKMLKDGPVHRRVKPI
ncbi:hypothetical protein M8C13_00105 [Crossiella sp. SN42]|uniref:hypothetical protein n=1 Tax=Crossiella sp. SN42 TaxID=2944808 RepID=UPI00207CDA95|nr:hypothetical protein [Crossiella sp. SN42]MCO1574159.1 hypothetical protein [Crossiella sp. SN42]